MTPQLLTTADELEKSGALTELLPKLLRESPKPLIAVIDSGQPYEAMARAIRAGGVPVFRSADQAVRSLGRYLCHRAARAEAKVVKAASIPKPRPADQPEKVNA